MSAPSAKNNSPVIVLIALVALILIMFFVFSKKQAATPVTTDDINATLDAGAQVELKNTSTSVNAIDADYKTADPSNLDAGI